ncbi:MAG: outer membrane beta-barrel protein [Chitinophagaceae bacterium]|nr:outer membrane beta-barrel protein [Chitinophagaceae bacterium]
MKVFLAALSVLVISLNSQAQTATLRGKLIDSTNKVNLANATISLLDIRDSTLEQFTMTKESGNFELKNISLGSYLIQFSYNGYEPLFKRLDFTKDQLERNLGNIYLEQAAKDLGNVTVVQTPIVIKKDTVEYNAGSFKTKPNADVEDLLKKMPGLQVEKDGSIKAQGEQVQRVLVDGKRFFGDDPKMATKNLPSDVIDKIQVFDALSDQSAFSGFDDGNRTKTINIITKKDKRKGNFGKATVGLGSDGEQLMNDHNLSLSNFNNGRQITVTGQGNNVNKQNFGVQDILGSLSSSGGRGGGGRGGVMSIVQSLIGGGASNGIVNTWSGGLNYGNEIGKFNDKLNSSGFYNNQRTTREQNSFTENLTSGKSDSSIFSNQRQSSFTNNKNGRFNLNLEKQLDSAGNNSIIFRPSINLQSTEQTTETNTSSTKSKTINLSNSAANTRNESSGYNGSIDFTFRHRFKKKGRTFTTNINLGRNENEGDGNNYSINEFFRDNVSNRKDTINQFYTTTSSTKNYGTTISYAEPISKFAQLEFAYNRTYSQTESDRKTFAYDDNAKAYTSIVPNLTNSFRNTYKADRGTLSYRLTKEKFNFTVGNGFQWGNLNSINRTTGNVIVQDYVNLFPTANFNYSFSKTQNLRFNYSGRTNQPSVTQLQPVIDNSDPLNIRTGNPNLNQRFTNNFRLFYNSFNILTQKIFFATINATFVSNDIQNSITVLNNGVQITQPVNLSGTYNILGFVNYGFPLRKPKSNLNFGINFNRNQSQSLVNGLSNYSRNTTLGQTISWASNLKEKWDFNLTSSTTYNMASYTLQPEQNANFFSQMFSAELTRYTKSGWIFSLDFDYTYNGGRTDGFNTSIPLLNASIAKQVFKDKAGEFKFYVFDLFSQNQSVTRSVASNYIQDMQTRVLTNYFTFSFTYNLRSFKPQQGQQMRMFMGPGGNRGGGMRF